MHFIWNRFYVLVKTLQQNKQLVEWLIYSDNSSKHCLPLLLPRLGHLCSRSNSLLYNQSFLHSFHSFAALQLQFIISSLHLGWQLVLCLALSGNKFFWVWWSLNLLPILFAIRWFPSFIHAWCFYSNMASVLRMQSQLWLESELSVECILWVLMVQLKPIGG